MKALLGSAIILFCGAVLAQAQQNVTIAVPNGTFDLRNVRVSKGGGAVNVRGELLNNTTSDWGFVSFRVVLYDRQGQRLSSDTFPVFDVKKGMATKVDGSLYGVDGNLTGNVKVKGDIGRFEITFDVGQYPAVYMFALAKPSVSRMLEHEDDVLQVTFSIPQNRQLAFNLRNKTENPIKFDWDQVSYVDPDGKSHKVMHRGVRFIERDRPQSAATIPPGASLEDFVYPTDAVTMIAGEWTTPMLFPEAPKAANFKGKSFSLFIPLEINGVTKNYNFVFTIDDVRM